MPTPVFPTLPNTAMWKFPIVFSSGSYSRYMYIQMNFVTSGDMPSPGDWYTFSPLAGAVYRPLLTAVMARTQDLFECSAYYNLPSRIVSVPLSLYLPVATNPPEFLVAMGASVFLETAINGKSFVGRIHWPFLWPGDWADSKITTAGVNRINTFFAPLIAGFTIYGVGHQLAVWSRKLNLMTPVTSLRIASQVTYLAKRHASYPGQKAYTPVGPPDRGLSPFPP